MNGHPKLRCLKVRMAIYVRFDPLKIFKKGTQNPYPHSVLSGQNFNP